MRCRALAVVVPAHNEEDRLAACLFSLHAAARRVAPLPVAVIVVADACTDATAAIAAAHNAHVAVGDQRNVGAARATGMSYALSHLGLADPGTWLATTDADTTVPDTWLTHQLSWAHRGYDAVLGTIRLEICAPDSAVAARHDADYFRTRPSQATTVWSHPHVHGANLGVSAAAYQHVGGFAALPTAEDHDLASRLHATGHRIARTDGHPVRTAARTRGRAPHGLADLLRAHQGVSGPAPTANH